MALGSSPTAAAAGVSAPSRAAPATRQLQLAQVPHARLPSTGVRSGASAAFAAVALGVLAPAGLSRRRPQSFRHRPSRKAIRVRFQQASQEVTTATLGEDPEVHLERAGKNARRIWTSIVIRSNVDEVWKVMTNYACLQDIVPNLIANDLLEQTPAGGARLYQVARASWCIPGIDFGFSFTAGCTLNVSLYPEGLPEDLVVPSAEATASRPAPLVRGKYPQPSAAIAGHGGSKDITMQNVEGEKGDFSHYQGVWRFEPLEDGKGMRLSFAVEVAPHWFLPVAPVESRIATALVENLTAIRDFVEGRRTAQPTQAPEGELQELAYT